MRSVLLACILVVLPVLAGATAPAAPVLLVVGDSLSAAYRIPRTAGWVHLLAKRLAAQGYDYRVVNASIPGDTTAGGLARLPTALARYRPALVIVELGGNDGLQGLPLVQMRSNLEKMVRLCRAAGADVLLIGVRMPPNYGAAYTERFAEVYREVARQTHAPLVPELLAGVAEHRDLMQEGGLHPLAKAEPELLDNVWPALRPLLQRSAAPGPASTRRHSGGRVRIPGAAFVTAG